MLPQTNTHVISSTTCTFLPLPNMKSFMIFLHAHAAAALLLYMHSNDMRSLFSRPAFKERDIMSTMTIKKKRTTFCCLSEL